MARSAVPNHKCSYLPARVQPTAPLLFPEPVKLTVHRHLEGDHAGRPESILVQEVNA